MKINYEQKLSWLSFFRVGIAGLCFFNFMAVQLDFDMLYYENSYSVPEISRFLSPHLLPTFYDIDLFLNKYFIFEYNTIINVFRIIYPAALILLLIGFKSRISAICSLLLFVLFENSYDSLYYGFDVFANFSLFYCVIFPVGKYNAITTEYKADKSNDDQKFLYLLRTHLSVAYFFSGFEKLLGFNWRNGESIWKAIHSFKSSEFINLDFLADTLVFLLMGWLTIILEMFYPLMTNLSYTSKIWLWGIIGLHLSIAVLMNLYFFSAIMIVLNLTAYYFGESDKIKTT